MMPLLTPWWQQRSRREQWLLSIMLAMLAGLGLWLAVLRPLAAARSAADSRLATASAALAEARGLAPLLGAAGAAPARAPLLARATARLQANGLGTDGLSITPDGQLQLALPSVRGPVLFRLVAGLEAEDGLTVTRLLVRRNADGTVSAGITARDLG